MCLVILGHKYKDYCAMVLIRLGCALKKFSKLTYLSFLSRRRCFPYIDTCFTKEGSVDDNDFRRFCSCLTAAVAMACITECRNLKKLNSYFFVPIRYCKFTFFRQITTFIKVRDRVAFIFGLQTL